MKNQHKHRNLPQRQAGGESRLLPRRATGPRSARGKAIASKNAQKHGILSKDVVLETENRFEFDQLHSSYMDHIKPVGPVERDLVGFAVMALWRLGRVQRAEGGAISAHRKLLRDNFEAMPYREAMHDESLPKDEREEAETRWREHCDLCDCLAAVPAEQDRQNLQRYESHLFRMYYRALSELERLQRMRLGQAVPPPVKVELSR